MLVKTTSVLTRATMPIAALMLSVAGYCSAATCVKGAGDTACTYLIDPSATFTNSTGATDPNLNSNSNPNIPTSARVQGIYSDASSTYDYHRVWLPQDNGANSSRHGTLVVFLPGSTANTNAYEEVSAYIAGLGYNVVNLSYRNRPGNLSTTTIGMVCNQGTTKVSSVNDCYNEIRYETAYGYKHAYAPGMGGDPVLAQLPSNMDPNFYITAPDSIVGRLVNLLYYLSNNSQYHDTTWSNFLVSDPSCTGTYHVGSPTGPCYYPKWSQIIVAGHSGGAAQAALLGVKTQSVGSVGLGDGVKRVVLFSAPDDNQGTTSGASAAAATWVTSPNKTLINNYWGMVSKYETEYSQCVSRNWSLLIGDSSATSNPNCDSGNYVARPFELNVVESSYTSINQLSGHFLQIDASTNPGLNSHDSTAADGSYADSSYKAKRRDWWSYLIRGGNAE